MPPLEPVIADFVAWFAGFAASFERVPSLPESVDDWISAVHKSGADEGAFYTALVREYTHLLSLLDNAARRDELATSAATVLEMFHGIERSDMLENRGYDPVTGTRSADTLIDDLKGEMARMARSEKPLCVAIVVIDSYVGQNVSDGDRGVMQSLQFMAGMLIDQVRAFDSVYRTGPAEFTVLFKDTDSRGGLQALHRMMAAAKLEGRIVEYNGQESPFSFSGILAAPFPDDDIHEILRLARRDLLSKQPLSNTVMEYFEMSELARYVKQSRKG